MSEMLKSIILEDDPLIAMDIKDLLEQSNIEVLVVFNHPDELFNYDNSIDYDLAILDIHLNAQKTGIDVAHFLQENKKCRHMFITSFFDKNTIQAASETNPIAYLLKPFEENEVLVNLELAKLKLKQPNFAINKEHNSGEIIFIKTTKSLVKVNPKDVKYIEAFDIYTKVYLNDQKIVASQSLKKLASIFESYGFVRVHRSFVVNLNYIEMIQEDEILIGDMRIPVGRTYKKDFMGRLNVL